MPTVRQQIETLIAGSASYFTGLGLEPFREVAGAADLQSIMAARVSPPGCYVYRSASRLSGNEHDDAMVQLEVVSFGIVIVVRNVRDGRFGDASDLVEAYADAVGDLLMGYQPSEQWSPMELDGGRVAAMNNANLFWLEQMRLTRQRRA